MTHIEALQIIQSESLIGECEVTHIEAQQVIQKHREIRERYKGLKQENEHSQGTPWGDSQFELDLGFGE